LVAFITNKSGVSALRTADARETRVCTLITLFTYVFRIGTFIAVGPRKPLVCTQATILSREARVLALIYTTPVATISIGGITVITDFTGVDDPVPTLDRSELNRRLITAHHDNGTGYGVTINKHRLDTTCCPVDDIPRINGSTLGHIHDQVAIIIDLHIRNTRTVRTVRTVRTGWSRRALLPWGTAKHIGYSVLGI